MACERVLVNGAWPLRWVIGTLLCYGLFQRALKCNIATTESMKSNGQID